MPLYISNYTQQNGGWAVWKVSETDEELQHMLPVEGLYINELSHFKAISKRYKERLAVRVLMYKCWDAEYEIKYNSLGKPYLENNMFKISISHTQGYVALCWHPFSNVGIDIEQVKTKALDLKNRYMHFDEYAIGDPLYEALLFWSGKETLYKMLLEQEDIDFRSHLRIAPFSIQVSGEMTGLDRRNPTIQYPLYYHVEDDFVLTWCYPL